MRTKNITALVIDENTNQRDSIEQLFLKVPNWEINVKHFVNDDEALEELKGSLFDLVLLNNERGVLGSLKKIRKTGYSEPIFIITRDKNEKSAQEMIKFGADKVFQDNEITSQLLSRSLNSVLIPKHLYPTIGDPHNRVEQRYWLLFQNAPVGIFLADREGIISQANIHLVSIMEKVSGTNEFPFNILDYLPLKNSGFEESYKLCLKNNEMVDKECSITAYNERKIYLRYQLSPILDGNRRNTGVQAVISDISSQKFAEEELFESRRRLMEMLTNIQLLAIMLDTDGNIVFGNDFLLSQTGWSHEDIIGENWYKSFLPGADGQKKNLFQLINPDESNLHYKSEIRTRDGKLLIVHWNNTFLKDQKGNVNGIASIGVDITENIKAENEIKRLSHTIIQVQEDERSRISMDIHDEVGQTLFALKLKMQQFFSSHDESHSQDSDEIMSMFKYISEYIRQFSHKISPIGLKNLGLPRAITRLTDDISQGANLTINLNLEALDSFFPDNWDINFYRVVQEALNNVMKHAEATEVDILVLNPGGRLLVRIRDNGKGMNTHTDKFRDQNVSGIGLMIMKERAYLMGAKINIRSQIGKGTEITIEIPKRT